MLRLGYDVHRSLALTVVAVGLLAAAGAITASKAEDAPPAGAADYARFAQGTWRKAFETAEKIPTTKGASFEKGVITLDDAYIQEGSAALAVFHDVIVRAQLKSEGGLFTRCANGSYCFWIGKNHCGINWNTLGKVEVLASCEFTAAADRFHEVAFATVGNRLLGFVDGRCVLQASNDKHRARGPIAINAHKIKSQFKDIEVMSLDGLDVERLLPEHDPLARYVGEWNVERTLTLTGKPPTKTTGKMLVERLPLGEFYGVTTATSEGRGSLFIEAYAQEKKSVRTWIFFSHGLADYFEKSIDHETGVQTVPPRVRKGVTDTGTLRPIDANTTEARFVHAGADGKPVAESLMRYLRQASEKQAARPNISAAGPAAEVPELAVLGPLAGKWVIDATVKPCKAVPDGKQERTTSDSRWILGGRFLYTEDFNAEGKLGNISVRGFDPTTKTYTFVMFQDTGNTPAAVETWNDKTKTLEGTAKNVPAGWKGVGELCLKDENSQEAWFTIKNEQGEAVYDVVAIRRRKVSSGDAPAQPK